MPKAENKTGALEVAPPEIQGTLNDLSAAYKALNVMADMRDAGEDEPEIPQVLGVLGLSDEDLNDFVEARRMLAEDPTQRDALAIKAKINDTIAQKLPATELGFGDIGGGFEPGDTIAETMMNAVKAAARRGAIDALRGDPVLVRKFWEDQGYQVREKNGKIEVKTPGSPVFQPTNPEGPDVGDFIPFLSFGLEAAAEGLASKKITGLSAAKMTIPTALAASGVQFGIGAGSELVRQTGSKLIGTREEFDIPLIGKRGAEAAGAGLVVSGAAKVARFGSDLITRIQRIWGSGLKQGTDDVIKKTRLLGLEPQPQQVARDPQIQLAGEQLAGLPFGSAKRGATQARDVFQKELDNLTKEVKDLKPIALAEKAKEEIIEEIEKRLSNADELYSRAFGDNFSTLVKGKTKNIDATMDRLFAQRKANPAARKLINGLREDLSFIENLNDLQNFRTGIGDKLLLQAGKGTPGVQVDIVNQLYKAATKDFQESLDTIIRGAKEAGGSKAKGVIEDITARKKAKAAADKMWAETHEAISGLVKRPGKKVKGSSREVAREFVDTTPAEKLITKIVDKKDFEKMAKVADDFPDAFDSLRKAELASIRENIFRGGEFDVKRGVETLRRLNDRSAAIIFGDDAAKKIDALVTVFDSMPGTFNITFSRLRDLLGSQIIRFTTGGFVDLVKTALSQAANKTEKDLLSRAANQLLKGKTVTAAQLAKEAGIKSTDKKEKQK